MEQSSPFVIDKKPIHIARRPWSISPAWDRIFPLDTDGTVYFTPPWNSCSYAVMDREKGNALISLMKKGGYFAIVTALLLLWLSWFFLWGSPCFWGTAGLSLWVTRFFLLRVFFPLKTRTLVENLPVGDPVPVDRNWFGVKRSKDLDARSLSIVMIAGAITAIAGYWWAFEEVSLVVAGGVLVIVFLMGGYYFLRLTAGKDLPLKLWVMILYCLGVVGWSALSFWLYCPPLPMDMGIWGKDRSSSTSVALGYLQSEISPVNCDRRLQKISYRPGGGNRCEWACYSLTKGEFAVLESSLQKNALLKIVSRENGLSPELYEKSRQEDARKRYPEWWNPGMEIQRIYCRILPDGNDLPEEDKKEFSYNDGRKASLPMEEISPVHALSYEILYNEESELLYFNISERTVSLFQHLLMLK